MSNCNNCDLKSQEINRLHRVCRTKDETINKAIIKIIALGSLLKISGFTPENEISEFVNELK